MANITPPNDEFVKKTILRNAEIGDLLDTSELKAFKIESLDGILQTHLVFPIEHPKGKLFYRAILREGEDVRKEVELELRWSNRKIDGFFRETEIPQKILYEQISEKALYEDSTNLNEEGIDLIGYINDKLDEDGYDEFQFLEYIINCENITEAIKSDIENRRKREKNEEEQTPA